MNRERAIDFIMEIIKHNRARDVEQCFKNFRDEISPVKELIKRYDEVEEYIKENLK